MKYFWRYPRQKGGREFNYQHDFRCWRKISYNPIVGADVRPLVSKLGGVIDSSYNDISWIQFAESQEFSNVWALQSLERNVLLSVLNSRTIFERDLLSSESVAKSTTPKPWVFRDWIQKNRPDKSHRLKPALVFKLFQGNLLFICQFIFWQTFVR